ncbi:MAG: tetratricopeptide repeat protein, partial [Candidatus Hydrogenedentes bacterium]|nr:tetratricopeptide repeat protein [Candidatus Hydrogenedentota bacterium]
RAALGDAYAKLKNFDEAARAYMMVAMIYDDAELSPECYIKAAEALKAKGDSAAATKMYQDLLNAYPKSKQAAVARARLGLTK